jgi:hypothetical protein
MPSSACPHYAKGCAMQKIASVHSKSGFAEKANSKSRTISSASAQKWIKAEFFYLPFSFTIQEPNRPKSSENGTFQTFSGKQKFRQTFGTRGNR